MSTTTQYPTIANIILAQLGGARFAVMTGARAFVDCGRSLRFRYPRAKDGSNSMEITLTPDDLYTIRTRRIHGVDVTERTTLEYVYADQLQPLFTQITGFATRL